MRNAIRRILSKNTYEFGDTPFDRQLKTIAERDAVPDQVTRMAKEYGLTPSLLSQEGWSAAFLIESCESCPVGETCFKDKRGNLVESLTIPPKACPNAKTFSQMATRHGLRKGLGIRSS